MFDEFVVEVVTELLGFLCKGIYNRYLDIKYSKVTVKRNGVSMPKTSNNNKLKRELVENFLKVHKDYLPRYTPKGLKLKWVINIIEEGKHDIMTGEYIGGYSVEINQKEPWQWQCLKKDNNIYRYNINNRSLENTGRNWYSSYYY